MYLSSGYTSAKPSAPANKIDRLVAGLSARGLQVRHAPDVGQPDSLADLTRHRQRVAGEHLHRNAQVLEFGDELLGIRPRRIVQRHQSDQCGGARLGAARHRQRPIALRGRFADARLQRLDCRGLESAGLGDGAHGAFHHAQPLPVLLDHGFRPPVFRIERCEGDGRDLGKVVEDVPLLRRGQEREVNRILVGFLRRERAGEQHVGFRRVLQRDHAGDGQLVHRDRARLVHAEHVHRRGILRGAEAGDQHAALGQLLRPDGHADREHDGEGDRHRAHQQDEHERDHLEERRAADQRQHDHHAQQRADDDEEPADDLGHHRFDVKLRTRLLHEFRGAAKIGLRPGQHHHAVAFAPADDGPRREHFAGRLVRVLRFAGERRLVHAQRSGEEFHVRRDDVAGSHANDVAGDQLPGGNDLPVRIAPDARTDLQPSPQCLNDAGGPALLHKAQHGVDNQQRAHHGEVRDIS